MRLDVVVLCSFCWNISVSLMSLYVDLKFNMLIAAEEKLANFHGEPSVRLNRGTSIYTDNPRTISHSFRTLNILLFHAPGRHLRTIEYLTCDGMISRRTWKEFSAGIQKSCSDLSVYVSAKVDLWGQQLTLLEVRHCDSSRHRGPCHTIRRRGAKYVSHKNMSLFFCCCVSWKYNFLFVAAKQERRNDRRVLFRGSACDCWFTVSPYKLFFAQCQMIQGFRDTSGTFENMAVAHSLPYGCLYWG